MRLLVPKLVEDGKKGPFDLECNYRCGEGDEQLVVKWFFNNETTPFYQWIAGVGGKSKSWHAAWNSVIALKPK